MNITADNLRKAKEHISDPATTHADIMALFDRAIALAEADG